MKRSAAIHFTSRFVNGHLAAVISSGARLYVGVGSNSNIAEKGLANEEKRAAIWEIIGR